MIYKKGSTVNKNAIEVLYSALQEVNKKYDDNIIFNRLPEHLNRKESRAVFTLRVKDSSGKGARRGIHNRRKMINACWHVHGDFFDQIFKIDPKGMILSCGQKITVDQGNWMDRNIGSQMEPVMYSESCDC